MARGKAASDFAAMAETLTVSTEEIMAMTELLERPVAFHPIFAKICGSVDAGLFLSQAYYFTGKSTLHDTPDAAINARAGYFAKSSREWEDGLLLSRYEQESARKRLREMKLLAERMECLPGGRRVWYRIEKGRLWQFIAAYIKGQNSQCEKLAEGLSVIPTLETSSATARNSQCLREKLAEHKTESTTENTYIDSSVQMKGQNDGSGSKRRRKQIDPNVFGDKPDSEELSSWFEGFWFLYPNKVKKAECLELIARDRPSVELRQKIVDGVQTWINSEQWQKEDGKYIPHPITFLRNQRWEELPRAARNVTIIEAQADATKPIRSRTTEEAIIAAQGAIDFFDSLRGEV